SPDLSRPNEGTPPNLDAPALADDNGLHRHGVVYAIAPSPLRAALVWAGTDDGYVWVTRDDSRTWQNVTPKALTPWSKVGTIEASHFDPQTAYAAVDRHRLDDYAPYIYKTHDGGATWSLVVSGIPQGSFVNAVREDTRRRGLLYAGTERGVYVSYDDGTSWQPLQLNLPVTSIRDLAVEGNDLAIATHGRAFWIMDDIEPLRQAAEAAASGTTYLFAPAPAYRLRPGNQEGTPLPLDEPQAQNPATGLYVDYYLADVTRSPVVIEILDADGKVVRRWSSAQPPKPVDPNKLAYTPDWVEKHPVPDATAGAHRFVWDFHQGSYDGPLVPPGKYAVRMSVNGQAYKRSAEVLRDPRSKTTDADLTVQYDLSRRIDALHAEVVASRTKAQEYAKSLSGEGAASFRRDVIGELPPENPDDSVGSYSQDVSSFLFIENSLDVLQGEVESADAVPTTGMQGGYAALLGVYRQTLARFDAMKK
ncbi:MAG TPA: hypothetical protein VHR97_11970, partial [Candidatus Baltobacteraceae bacterium]|nr:hypothetical protein [Candidatus Baltobacteraceae bacterium]